jgi:PAS domain S-box-containing protein
LRSLDEMRQRNQLILDCAGEGIYGLDCEGRTTFINRAAAQMTGWQPEEMLGQRNHDLVHHSHPDGTHYDRTSCPIYSAFKDGKVHTVDNEVFWRKDGSSFEVEYTSTPIVDDQGELAGAVVTFRDITLRKENERYLNRALTENKKLRQQLEQENHYLRTELQLANRPGDILGESAAIKTLLYQLEQVAATDATTLVLGETGTGKELIAAAIHNQSTRSAQPLVKVNCAALPPTLIESELFGHEKGAFSGATSRKIGRFERAHGGTLFLDEVGELPLELQAKLLRVLQEGELERVGSSDVISVDVRIIAATNRDLEAAVAARDFREDLFYRLNVFPLEVPPLRERQGDIALLAHAFCEQFASRQGKTIDSIARRSLTALEQYPWPGNVRELQNVIERAVILCQGTTLRVENLQQSTARTQTHSTLDEVQRQHIIQVLDDYNWAIHGAGKAAAVLGINPSTLRSRMKKLGIEKPRLKSRG